MFHQVVADRLGLHISDLRCLNILLEAGPADALVSRVSAHSVVLGDVPFIVEAVAGDVEVAIRVGDHLDAFSGGRHELERPVRVGRAGKLRCGKGHRHRQHHGANRVPIIFFRSFIPLSILRSATAR